MLKDLILLGFSRTQKDINIVFALRRMSGVVVTDNECDSQNGYL